ncbi:MAG TPA: endonuclease/exonuclease/phosphatase family protein [Microbacterium sp.]|uniref:endonuclease/exonuclease/phosphatase family protein n=1 Tax=Microbacterium sp. TaxID=51671 RepID=UPI002CEC280B|nr:endonuclease/exonuclease/phosphatase family protein [Microbacterium sp.]HWI31711.1 endonuclease/exonuclease/phosphatase family protein [Microbacterium sp.]
MLRLFGILATVLFAVAAAVLTWPSFFRLERTYPVAQIVSFRGLVVAGFLGVIVLALLLALPRTTRGFAFSIVLVAAIAVAANAGIMMSRGLGADTLPASTDTSVRVMTWNTAGEATPSEAVAKTAVAMDADIIALPETAESVGESVAVAMREMGRPMWVHHVRFNTEIENGPQAWETTILISPELGDYSVIESSRDGSSNTGVVPSAVAMPVDGDGPIVVAVHAVAPRSAYMPSWRDDLQWLADQCAAANVIMAGDFNATLDHMSGLGVGNATLGQCRDAAAETGNGAVGTWTSQIPALAGAPIDHVMYSSHWKPTGSVVLRSMDDSGSDHRPLVVQLEPVG